MTKTTVDAPLSDENIPLDTAMKLFYTDERGVTGQSWAWTDSVLPYYSLKVTARGAILTLKQRVSEVNGKVVGENGHYLLQNGTNTVVISLLAYNEGNDIGYNTVLSTKLDLDVDLVCTGTNDFYTYNEQTGIIAWEPAHILPGARRKIPITVLIYKEPEETNEMGVAAGFSAFFADKEEGGEIKMESAPAQENVTYVPGFDLTLSQNDISVSNLSITEGDNVVITANIRLTGGKKAEDVNVRIFDNGKKITQDLATGYIAGGDSMLISKVWETLPHKSRGSSAGVHTLSCVIDQDNMFDEENEGNNAATITITVYPQQTGSIATTLNLKEPTSSRATLFANEPITFSGDFRRTETNEPIGRIIWKKEVSGESLYSVALADIDANGKENEIISAGKNAGYVYDSKGNKLWSVPAQEGSFCSAGAMDADSNGFLDEVALLNIDKGLYLFNKNGGFIFTKNTTQLGGSPCLSIKACDTQPDLWSSNEIAVLVRGKLSVWTGTGTKLWDASVSPSATKIAIGDVDKNGMMDNLICGDKAFDRDGNLIRTYPTVGRSVGAGDLNGDGFCDEVVLGNQSLSAFNSTGTLMWTRFSGSDLIDEILVINLDSDNKNDVVCEKDNILYGLKNTGTTTQILWQYPTGNITPISAGDIDADGIDEIIAVGDKVYAFEKNGSLTLSHPLSGTSSTVALSDINSDGAADILSASSGVLGTFQEAYLEIKFDDGAWQSMTWDDGLSLWKATQSFVKPGTHSYQVNAAKGGYIEASASSNFYLSQIANVILRKKASTPAILEGGTITYTIEYENIGEGTATNVTIIDVIPENTSLQ
ncbi:hypothetical protein HY772_06985, partial [Candidatus Woesearchaeota archaeon]|nr:hypothetical protein [Candidatus Woesearchaeota archaeon]